MAKWIWPIQGGAGRISSGVGKRWGTHHKGMDIAVASGTPVLATRDGKVIAAVPNACAHNTGKAVGQDNCAGGRGNYINIDHGDGYVSHHYHLTDVHVRTGDRVTQGQPIGTVGSTGNSTGPHLHFEVKYNGSIVDPETLVNASNSIIAPDVPTSRAYDSTSSTSNSSYISPYENIDSVVGERVSDVTEQPMHAYYELRIGDTPITILPNIYQSLEMNRIDGAGDVARITLFDDDWVELEELLADNWNNVQLVYGYQNDSKNISSQVYNMLLTDYNITMNPTGVILAVTAISQGSYDNLRQVNIATNTYNPTEAVKAIAKYMGWNVIDENFDVTTDISDMPDPFTVLNDFPVSYIINNIQEYATTPEGESVKFHLDSDNTVYFQAESTVTKASVEAAESGELRTYIYMKGYDSPVISIDFNIGGVFGGTSQYGLASGLRTSVFDTETKQEFSIQEDMSTVINEEYFSHMRPNQSIPSVDSGGLSYTQAKARLYNRTYHSVTQHYKATMVIVGDPTIKMNEIVWIINVMDNGFPHHTSGAYQVLNIMDSISAGQMTTTLELVRHGDINNGVEIVTPKLTRK